MSGNLRRFSSDACDDPDEVGPIDPPGFAATGKSIEVPGLDEYRFRDGLLIHYEAYHDQIPLLRQIGVVPTSGSGLWPLLTRLRHLGARRGRRR